MTRAELLERYRALPLPTSQGRVVAVPADLGFDPESFAANGVTEVVAAPAMLELEAAGIVRVSNDLEDRPGARGHPLSRSPSTRGLASLWARTKFAAHNAAEWRNGLLVHVPKGVVLEQPLLMRIVNSVDSGSLFWRLLVVAEPGSRVSVIEEYASTTRSSPAT